MCSLRSFHSEHVIAGIRWGVKEPSEADKQLRSSDVPRDCYWSVLIFDREYSLLRFSHELSECFYFCDGILPCSGEIAYLGLIIIWPR